MSKIDLEYVCENCGEVVANGVGPSGMPIITTILNMLPSSSIFYRDACDHDMNYHRQIGRELADNMFLTGMRLSVYRKYPEHKSKWYDYINPANGYRFSMRKFFMLQADRNYVFVDKFGSSAYKEGICKCLKRD